MSAVQEFTSPEGEHQGWAIRCPGCQTIHVYDSRWTFNGNMEKPTFDPSYLAKWDFGEDRKQIVCHSFVTDGGIRFPNDCTHLLAGESRILLDFDKGEL